MVALKFEGDMVASQIMKLVGFIYANLSGYSTLAWATTIAGVFVAISVSVSMFLLFHHLSAYKNPEEQKFLIGVILMVPCYAVESLMCNYYTFRHDGSTNFPRSWAFQGSTGPIFESMRMIIQSADQVSLLHGLCLAPTRFSHSGSSESF